MPNVSELEINGTVYTIKDTSKMTPAEANAAFAPIGFGLGVGTWNDSRTRFTDISSLNEYNKNGYWAYQNADAPLISDDANTRYVYGDSLAMSSSFVTHRGVCVYNGVNIQRQYITDSWQPWEYVNPPMNVDVEYRTTERYNGSVVYRKRVSYTNGSAIAATDGIYTLSIPHGIKNLGIPFETKGRYTATAPMPLIGANGTSISVYRVTTSAIEIRLNKVGLEADISLYFDLRYTKTT